ncbi:MAG: energy transducer TonB [Aquificaceae bacterium]
MTQYRWSFSIAVSLAINIIILMTLSIFVAFRAKTDEPLRPLKLIEINQTIGSRGAKPEPLAKDRASKPQIPLVSEEAPKEPSILGNIESKISSRLSEDSGSASEKGTGAEGFGIDLGERKLVYKPPFPKLSSDEPLSSVVIKITVEPSGIVSKAQIIQRSGSAEVDRALINFCMSLKFAPINSGEVQTGTVSFKLRGG